MSKVVDRLLAGLEWVLDRGPVLIFASLATWHAALTVVAMTVVIGKWTTRWLDFAVEHAFWALFLGYVASVIHDNQRLRKVVKSPYLVWQEGFNAGVRDEASRR